jgi:single-strand DNA-binding protein
MYHEVSLVGNLGRTPELRSTPDGTPVSTLNVAVNNSYTDSNGNKVKETQWWRVTVWRRLAEVCAEWLTKGRQVLVKGRMTGERTETGDNEYTIEPRVWEDRDGNHRASFEMVANLVKFLGSGGNGAGFPDEPEFTDEDEEIPF